MGDVEKIEDLAKIWDEKTAGKLPPSSGVYDDIARGFATDAIIKCANREYWERLFLAASSDNFCVERGYNFDQFIRRPAVMNITADRAKISIDKYKARDIAKDVLKIKIERTKADMLLAFMSLSEADFLLILSFLEENFGKNYSEANKAFLYKNLHTLDKETFGKICEQLLLKCEWLPKISQITDASRSALAEAKIKRAKVLKEKLAQMEILKCERCNNSGHLNATKSNYGYDYRYVFRCSCDFGDYVLEAWPKFEDRLLLLGFKIVPYHNAGKKFSDIMAEYGARSIPVLDMSDDKLYKDKT